MPSSYPAADARTIREHLIAADIDPSEALGNLAPGTLDRLTVRYPTLRDDGSSYLGIGGEKAIAGFADVRRSEAFPDLVFKMNTWNVYLDVHGKLHQSG